MMNGWPSWGLAVSGVGRDLVAPQVAAFASAVALGRADRVSLPEAAAWLEPVFWEAER
jgi:hypothetical protein